MSAQVEGSKTNILRNADALPPLERLYYLELLQSETAKGSYRFIDTENEVDATKEINAWLQEKLKQEAIPDGYFAYCMGKIFEATHPGVHAQLKAGLVDSLGKLTIEEAHGHGTMEGFSAEQVPILYAQMQTWVAQQERPAAANLN